LKALSLATERGGISTIRGDFLVLHYRDAGGAKQEEQFQFRASNLETAFGPSFEPVLKQASQLIIQQHKELLRKKGSKISAIVLSSPTTSRTLKGSETLKKAVGELMRIDERVFDFAGTELRQSRNDWGVTYRFADKTEEIYSFVFPVKNERNKKLPPPLPPLFLSHP